MILPTTGPGALATAFPAEECLACADGNPRGECPKAPRLCGHHCNHASTHDRCCWCGASFEEEEGAA